MSGSSGPGVHEVDVDLQKMLKKQTLLFLDNANFGDGYMSFDESGKLVADKFEQNAGRAWNGVQNELCRVARNVVLAEGAAKESREDVARLEAELADVKMELGLFYPRGFTSLGTYERRIGRRQRRVRVIKEEESIADEEHEEVGGAVVEVANLVKEIADNRAALAAMRPDDSIVFALGCSREAYDELETTINTMQEKYDTYMASRTAESVCEQMGN